MSSTPKNPVAGGLPLAICAIAGGLIGARNGQPSLGVLLGVVAGLAIAGAIWLLDRR